MDGAFIKMHGLGNDFVIVDSRDHPVSMTTALARAIANRHTGIGCDQVIMLEPSTVADVRMRIWNADGSEAQSCGNANRCVAKLIGGDTRIETAGGILDASANGPLVSVGFPEPRFDAGSIPLAYAMDTADMPVGWDQLSGPMAVNVGNPHLVFFVDNCDAIALEQLGPMIEHDPLFPERINVNVATITSDTSLRLRVWERGSGLTLACGTGAVATAVCAIRSRRAVAPVTVNLPGGDLVIDWSGSGPVSMHGPATEVYRGRFDWAAFA